MRQILDDAGLDYVRVLVSGGLDEYEIERLVTGGAPIDMFGVGTRVGVSGDAPWCDLVYKMVCYDGRPVMKLSGGKESLPGEKQVFRLYEADGTMLKDVIGLAQEAGVDGQPLLADAMTAGALLTSREPINETRQARCRWSRQPERRLPGGCANRPAIRCRSAWPVEELTQQTRDEIGSGSPA